MASWTVPDGWRQGRGAFGGLTIAALLDAVRDGIEGRPVRAVTAELFAPIEAGPAEIDTETLRAGSSVNVVRAWVRQRGEVRGHVVVTAGARRKAGASELAWNGLVAPVAPPWRDVPVAQLHAGSPEFVQHYEYRIVDGLPGDDVGGTGSAATIGWVRPRAQPPQRDAGYLAQQADAWYPAVLRRMSIPRPLGTIAYTLEIVDGTDGLDPAAPLLYRGTVPVCRDGYFLETRELWGEDGRLVALNHQTFAIIA